MDRWGRALIGGRSDSGVSDFEKMGQRGRKEAHRKYQFVVAVEVMVIIRDASNAQVSSFYCTYLLSSTISHAFLPMPKLEIRLARITQ
jgi:hypothetical protein